MRVLVSCTGFDTVHQTGTNHSFTLEVDGNKEQIIEAALVSQGQWARDSQIKNPRLVGITATLMLDAAALEPFNNS